MEVAKSYAFLVTENRTLANDIFIPKDKLKGGKTGDKAIVKITEWPDKAKNPIGQVIDILGKAGDNTTEMHAILAEFGLPYVYPKAVETAADKIPAEITPEEIAKREDFRKVTTFTIDPKDAKGLRRCAFHPLHQKRIVGSRRTHRRCDTLCKKKEESSTKKLKSVPLPFIW